jgi:hypothetical protein
LKAFSHEMAMPPIHTDVFFISSRPIILIVHKELQAYTVSSTCPLLALGFKDLSAFSYIINVAVQRIAHLLPTREFPGLILETDLVSRPIFCHFLSILFSVPG